MNSDSGIGIATLTVADQELDDDVARLLIDGRLAAGGHRIVAHAAVADSESKVRAQLQLWIADPEITAIVTIAGPSSVRALEPLITEQRSHHVRCGSTLVFVLPPSIAETSDALDRIVLPELARQPLPARGPSGADLRMTTDAIAVIGDLPPAADPVSLVDLRRGGKVGLWTLALAGAAFAGGLAGVTYKAIQKQHAEVAHAEESDIAEVESEPTPVVPQPQPQPQQLQVSVQPKPAPPPRAKPAAPKRTATRPETKPRVETPKPIDVPPELEATPALEDTCSEESCAAHGNERECCTPYRTHPARLDRASIARVLATVKPHVLDCRETSAEGDVKLSIHVGSDGRVTKAMVIESPEASVGQCVADKLRDAAFPATTEGGSFVYRFDLTP